MVCCTGASGWGPAERYDTEHIPNQQGARPLRFWHALWSEGYGSRPAGLTKRRPMTMIHRRVRRVASVCGAPVGLLLAACRSGDPVGTGTDPEGTLIPGQAASLSPAGPLTLEGGESGTENVLVLVDTLLTSGNAKFTYQVS